MTEPTPMTGHERLTCALEHREPDRVPFDLGGSTVSGIIAWWETLQEYGVYS